MVWNDGADNERGMEEDTVFTDRTDAGLRLARRLRHLRSPDVAVVGLPRGGVPVALEVARELAVPLDVIIVRKLGVPFRPELAMGAIGEGGVRVINEDLVARIGISAEQIAQVEAHERQELLRRVERLRAGRQPIPLDRTVIIVDDGLATGATARAACQVARAHGAERVVLAVPVAPSGWRRQFAGAADELVCVTTPLGFSGVSAHYRDFPQVPDDDVLACLAEARR